MERRDAKDEKPPEAQDMSNQFPELFAKLPDLPEIDEIFPPEGLDDYTPANDERNEIPIVDQIGQPESVPHVNQARLQNLFPEVPQSVFPGQNIQPLFDPVSCFQQGVPSQNPKSVSNALFNTIPIYNNPPVSQASQRPLSQFRPHADQAPHHANPLLSPALADQESQLATLFPSWTTNSTRSPGDIAGNAHQNRGAGFSMAGDTLIPEHVNQNGNTLQPPNVMGTNYESTENAQDPASIEGNASSQRAGVKRFNGEALDTESKRVRICEQNETFSEQAGFKGSVLQVWTFGGHDLKLVSVEDPKSCEACGRRYATLDQLNKHIKTSHTNRAQQYGNESDPDCCTCCNRRFKNKTNLRRHISSVHKEDNEIYCSHENCPANFSSRHALVMHQRDSHNIVPDSRKKRQMSHQNRVELGDVENPHGDLKVYVCGTCNIIAENKGNILRHIRIMHLRRCDFVCNRCNLKFRTKSNLQAHESSKTCLRKAQPDSSHSPTEAEPAEGSEETTENSQEAAEASQES